MWMFDVAATPTVTAGAYSAGDIVGGLMTFSVAKALDVPVKLTSVLVTLKAAVTPSMRLIIFNADPSSTTTTDNAAYSLNAADAFKVRCTIPINALGGYVIDHGTPNTYEIGNLDKVIKPAAGSLNLYALLIDDTGVTLASTSDLQVVLSGEGA